MISATYPLPPLPSAARRQRSGWAARLTVFLLAMHAILAVASLRLQAVTIDE